MKVLVVDDSVVFRSAIKGALMTSGFVDTVEIAANGKIAVEKLKQDLTFDSVTLDLEMPVMDGIATIKEIRAFDKDIPIIIFSAQNLNAANKTLEALKMGADDFVSKISTNMDLKDNLKMIQDELIPRFRALIDKKLRNKKSSERVMNRTNDERKELIDKFKPEILCMAASTGGPDILMKIFSGMEKMNIPVVLVQHMPPLFTTQLAKSLNKLSSNTVVEAKAGDELLPGHVYLAPGDYHMSVKRAVGGKYIISLEQTEKVCFVRPAADVLFKSVAKNFEGKIASIVFTGMGNDGAEGAKLIKNKEGIVLIQDENSSVVWGMPGAVFNNNTYDGIFSPEDLIKKINKFGSK